MEELRLILLAALQEFQPPWGVQRSQSQQGGTTRSRSRTRERYTRVVALERADVVPRPSKSQKLIIETATTVIALLVEGALVFRLEEALKQVGLRPIAVRS